MDSGFLSKGEILDDDYDVLKTLLPEEVIGIMDQLLCYEVCSHCRSSRLSRGCLILIPGSLDGMAYGSSAFSLPFRFPLYRSFALARPKNVGRGPIRPV